MHACPNVPAVKRDGELNSAGVAYRLSTLCISASTVGLYLTTIITRMFYEWITPELYVKRAWLYPIEDEL